jgi:hypothetical protein
MEVRAVFPTAREGTGMYESFYLRAVAPEEPLGAWLRYTVHKRPGHPPRGSLWCTVFDATRGRPYMNKLTTSPPRCSQDTWIAIADARLDGAHAHGSCGEASWSLRFDSDESELRHLPSAWMYRARIPRTKLTSPTPDARFKGTIELPDRPALSLDGWRGMVGHNWGAEHAERWIWLHGVDFAGDETAWIDLALGRILVAGRLTPWIANGALSLGGVRTRLGGLARRGVSVEEDQRGCTLTIPGEGGATVRARVQIPPESAAGWRYADPNGGEHDVLNCSVAALELQVSGARAGAAAGDEPRGELRERTLTSAHGGAYELGMRAGELHEVPLAPFPDG